MTARPLSLTVQTPDVITFTLPLLLDGLNVRDRQHWTKRRKATHSLYLHTIVAIGGPRCKPIAPLSRARVTVIRRSSGSMDADNLAASCKNLLDVLCPQSDAKPWGIGFIEDDNARHIELVTLQEYAPRGKGSTIVRIERLEAI